MKLYKFMLGFGGVMALALTSCHEDPEYVPAEAVVTPPAYFNMSDETAIDLEETSTDFVVHVYRADANGVVTAPVTATVTAPDGVDANIFTIPTSVEFADGVTTADIKVTFNMDDIVPMKDYIFDFKVDGESTPYFLTQVKYDVSYVPWETVVSKETGNTLSKLDIDAILTRPWSVEVEVQKHPGHDGLFRVRHPFYGAPEVEGTAQIYPEEDPLWLYINADNPRSVYFSDSKGKPSIYYHTGWNIYVDDYPDNGGEVVIVCPYSAYLSETNIIYDGANGGYDYKQFDGDAGTETNHVISFGDKLAWLMPGRIKQDPDANYLLIWNDFKLTLADADVPPDWEVLGMATYQDGFLSNAFDTPVDEYQVTIEQKIAEPTTYRLLNPYLASGGFPYPTIDDGEYNLVFDCKDPDMVLMELQPLGYVDNGQNYQGCNAGAWHFYGYGEDGAISADQIKAQGLNDKLENNVITLAHPIVVAGTSGQFLWMKSNFTPGKIVLPEPSEAKNFVTKTNKKPTLNSGRLRLRNDFPLHRVANVGRYHQAK